MRYFISAPLLLALLAVLGKTTNAQGDEVEPVPDPIPTDDPPIEPVPILCPPNSNLPLGATQCHCNSGYYSAGNNPDGSLNGCYKTCPANSYPQINAQGSGTGNCIACPPYATSSGSQVSCTCDAISGGPANLNAFNQVTRCSCPANSELAYVNGNNRCQCVPGWRQYSTTGAGLLRNCVPLCDPNKYPVVNSSPFYASGECRNCPTYSSSTGLQNSCTCNAENPRLTTNPAGQTSLCSCPANASRSSLASPCSCNVGFYPRGTYADGSLRTCLPLCPVNQYPVLTSDGRPIGGCTTCPARSTSLGTTYECTCSPLTGTTSTTPAGQVATCSECPSPYVTSTDGRGCVLPPSPASHVTPRAKRDQHAFDLCPTGEKACRLSTSPSDASYECAQLDSDLENCGECGNSCLTISGGRDVACISGQCNIASCQEGFELSKVGLGSCKAAAAKARKSRHRK